MRKGKNYFYNKVEWIQVKNALSNKRENTDTHNNKNRITFFITVYGIFIYKGSFSGKKISQGRNKQAKVVVFNTINQMSIKVSLCAVNRKKTKTRSILNVKL